jgi:hypothetical protein
MYIVWFWPGGPDLVYFNLADRTVPRHLQFGKERSMSIKIDADFEKVTFFGVEYRLKALEVSSSYSSSFAIYFMILF